MDLDKKSQTNEEIINIIHALHFLDQPIPIFVFQVLCCLHSCISVKRRIRLVSVSSAQFLSNSYLSFSSSKLTALTAQHSLTGLKRQMHGQSQITTFWVKDLDVMREIWDAWQMFSFQKLSHDLPLKAILSKLMLFSLGWENIIRIWLMNNLLLIDWLIDWSFKFAGIFEKSMYCRYDHQGSLKKRNTTCVILHSTVLLIHCLSR